ARAADRADHAAGSVVAVHRRGRGARRARPDPPRAPAHSAGPDTVGRCRAGGHHDRCDGAHAGGRGCRGGADLADRRAPRCVRRLRPLAAGAASRVVTRPSVGEIMTLFYGWIIVAAGVVVTCIGLGAMLSLSIFLQPMSEATGWSRTGISTAALLNWLSMGVGSFAWGALSDRFGTRAVVLCGGVLLGLGLVTASQAATLGQFQLLFGVIVGFAAGSLYTPMTATTTRWFTRHRSLAVALVSAGLSLGSATAAPLARWLITSYDWRTAMLVLGDLAWLVIIPSALLVREPPPLPTAAVVPATAVEGPELTVAQALRTPQFAAIALTFFACCAAHSGPIFHMVTYAIDHGVPAMAAATVLSAAGVASLGGKIICGLVADRVGAKRVLVTGLALQAVAVSLYLVTRETASFYALALMFGFA